ncbi:MAG: anthranilate synthase component I family protein, partial [Flavobacteriaceae bacterium]
MRKKVSFQVADITHFKDALLEWAQQFDEVCWMDSNGHKDPYSSFDVLLAVDGLTSIVTDSQNAFEKLKVYEAETKDWIFGYLSYDLKNDVEALRSDNFDGLHFPELYFFQPKKMIAIYENKIEFNYLRMVDDEIETDFEAISVGSFPKKASKVIQDEIHIKLRIFKDEYFRRIDQVLRHIQQGDIYEANFCQEFYAENAQIDALQIYKKLNKISQAPFATFLRLNDKYLLSASPERYLKKMDNKVVSQPIKGTAKRSIDPLEDETLVAQLKIDSKERAENIMIVDLVRNDLSRSAKKGSVIVESLCNVHTFKQVHQMISTISSIVEKDKNPIEIIKDTFPMGSMTGAPKVSAMNIIEALEPFKRGLYSGAVGYFAPNHDFDFNVVIRSILYNETEKYVSYAVGGAITAKSDPKKEY